MAACKLPANTAPASGGDQVSARIEFERETPQLTEKRVAAEAPPPSVAVLIPCYNEAASIATVVRDFRRVLPTASIFVYDNDSTDGTAEIARRAGAIVRRELRRGKGNVVRRMFADIDADVFVLVDGDNTYDPGCVNSLIDRL